MMPVYCALILEGTRLESSEMLEAGDLIDALQSLAERHRSKRVEVWEGGKRQATLPPAAEGRHTLRMSTLSRNF